MPLSHRQRVFKALEHQKPDRVPLDWSWFRMDVWENLRAYLRARDNETVLRRLGVDFREFGAGHSREFLKEAKLIYPLGWYKPLANGLFQDEWGIVYEKVSTGTHWRTFRYPLANVQNLDNFELPDLDAPGRFEHAEKEIPRLKDTYIIMAGWFELFDRAWYLRGYDRFIKDMYLDPSFANALLDKIFKYDLECGNRFVDMGVDIILLCDDIATQTSLMFSPGLWRKYYKPRFKQLIDSFKKRGCHYFLFDSDGDLTQIYPDLIETGFQIISPSQPECMNLTALKREFGDKICFRGAISVQRTIPFGTNRDVEEEVIRTVKTLGHNGGLIVAPSHTPQPNDPIQNVVAVYETAKKIRNF